MLTYIACKSAIKESYDLEELIISMPIMIFTPILDIIFIFFQPIFYITYKGWVKENE